MVGQPRPCALLVFSQISLACVVVVCLRGQTHTRPPRRNQCVCVRVCVCVSVFGSHPTTPPLCSGWAMSDTLEERGGDKGRLLPLTPQPTLKTCEALMIAMFLGTGPVQCLGFRISHI